MTELGDNITWSPLLEDYFKRSAEKAQCYAWLYAHAEQIYSSRRTYIDLPVNVISGLVGFFSVGSATMFNGETKMSSIALGVASLLVTIMNSTKSYFSWDKKSEGCKISAIHYGKLYRFIVVELGLPRAERMRANDFLKFVRDTYDRLAETSYALPPESVDAFKKRFSNQKYLDISKPEITNGLERVNIYADPTEDKKEDSKEDKKDAMIIRVPSTTYSLDAGLESSSSSSSV
jgi:hypothetical protein